jgi:N-acetylglutamate synthase-like GNAT family acetyltransferase
VDIRPYTKDLEDQVTGLILGIQRDEFEIPITLEEQPDLLDVDRHYRSGGGELWVALEGGRVAGTIALVDNGEGIGSLRKMFVDPRFRGSGIAARLLGVLLEHARARGLRAIYLGTTAKYLAAHRFYEKRGFVRIEREELPARCSITQVDTRFYRLDLVSRQSD